MAGPNGDRLIYFTAGVSLVLMMYSVVRHATTLFASEPEETRNILGMVEDSMLFMACYTSRICSALQTVQEGY